jgi:hypothetical protein
MPLFILRNLYKQENCIYINYMEHTKITGTVNSRTGTEAQQTAVSLLPDEETVWEWQKKLSSFGTRLTGSPGQNKLTGFIEEQLRGIGLEVYRDKHTFTRWSADSWSLSVQGTDEVLPVAAYYPYSGTTGPEGICAPPVFCGKSFRGAEGKIAVVEVSNIRLPSFLLFRTKKAIPASAALPLWISNPVIGSVLAGTYPDRAKKAGAAAVICVWKGMSDAEAAGQYLPFTVGPRDCPALWVGQDTGRKLRRTAAEGRSVRLVLDAATDESAVSETLYAVLPGENHKETLIINTHTDGPNACEENGAVALLAAAKALSQIPADKRKRDCVFVFVTGHFQIPQFGTGGQATTRWLHDHPEFWDGKGCHAKASAGITIEHLGCTEWADNADHTAFAPTGRIDREFVYTSSPLMNRIYTESLEKRTKLRTVILDPAHSRYFGEGEPLYRAGIPTISLVPAPEYLCTISDSGLIERLDRNLLYEQIQTFTRAAEKLVR